MQNPWVLLIVVVLGLGARMGAASLGHNYDMESWYTVADITGHGGNVYTETTRYNYGPIWFFVLHVLDMLAGHRHEVLRWLIAVFLSLIDLGIFFVLCRQAGRIAGALFFLNPVSILITGFHCQFDNMAILLGLYSVLLFGDDFENPVNGRKFLGLLVLGFSLVTKHLLFVFPVWLAVKQKGLPQKIIILFVPTACFLLGFAPYWEEGREGIIHNVFGYSSMPANFFYNWFVPPCIQYFLSSRGIWLGMLILFAFICRKRNGFESLLIYSGALVAFSPATTNQYLVIPVPLMAVFPSVLFILYTVLSTLHICEDVQGPPQWQGLGLKGWYFNDVAIYTLCFAIIWLLWRPQIVQLYQNIRREVQIQLGLLK